MQTHTIQERIDLYLEYKEAYYTGEPLISDDEFDKFETSLIEDGFDPIVGYDDISDSRKTTHRNMMLSLQKVKILDDTMPIDTAKMLFDRFGNVSASWKYDGCALNTTYISGELSMIATRGNGKKGTNLLQKLKHLFPQTINQKINVDIRSELVIDQNVFVDKYSKTYSHSRNLVAGICNDIDPNDERKYDLIIRTLEAIDDNQNFVDIETLHEDLFINKKTEYICNSAEEIKSVFDRLSIGRKDFNIGTDGLVLSSLSKTKWVHDEHYPSNALAIKFRSPETISTVTNILWKLHKSGNYFPIVIFEPIIIDGRSIKQASGNNIDYLIKNNISIGSKIRIVIANDIIPYLQSI